MENIAQIIEKYRNQKSALVGLLQDIDEECGYLPEEVLKKVSEELDIPLSKLFSLATFYTSFRLEPYGKHRVCVCVGTACHVKGAGKIVDALEQRLNIKAGGTTEDGEITLETVNCLGTCALSPIVTIDNEYHGQVDPGKITKLIKKLQDK